MLTREAGEILVVVRKRSLTDRASRASRAGGTGGTGWARRTDGADRTR